MRRIAGPLWISGPQPTVAGADNLEERQRQDGISTIIIIIITIIVIIIVSITITIIQNFFDVIGGKLGQASLFDFSLPSPLSPLSLLLFAHSCINCVPWLSLVSCPSRRSLC